MILNVLDTISTYMVIAYIHSSHHFLSACVGHGLSTRQRDIVDQATLLVWWQCSVPVIMALLMLGVDLPRLSCSSPADGQSKPT